MSGMHLNTYMHTCTRPHTCGHTCTHMHIQYTHTHVYANKCINARTCLPTSTCIHTLVCTHKHTYTSAHTLAHRQTKPVSLCAHTHTHTHPPWGAFSLSSLWLVPPPLRASQCRPQPFWLHARIIYILRDLRHPKAAGRGCKCLALFGTRDGN